MWDQEFGVSSTNSLLEPDRRSTTDSWEIGLPIKESAWDTGEPPRVRKNKDGYNQPSGVPDWIHGIRCQHIDALPDV